MSDLNYPIDEMSNVASQMKDYIQMGEEYKTYIQSMIDEASLLPGDMGTTIPDYFREWKTSIEELYTQYDNLAKNLSGGAVSMSGLDTDITTTFHQSS